MWRFGIIIGLVLYAPVVYSEVCTTNDNCTSTMCGDGHSLICEHPEGSDGILPDGGLCTCAADLCFVRDDCLLPAHPELNCDNDRRHCYDNHCICSRWPIGGN